MLQNQASFEVRKLNETISLIDIQGEVNAYAESALLEAYARASQPGVQTVILDFSRMHYMNS